MDVKMEIMEMDTDTTSIVDAEMLSLREQLKDIVSVTVGDDGTERGHTAYDKSVEFHKLIAVSDIPTCCAALESHPSDSSMSVFELACNTSNRKRFIKFCVSVGCDVNKRNPKCGRRPISFAIEQFEKDNLAALLSDISVGVDFEHSNDFPYAPINYVLERIWDDEDVVGFEKKFECFQLLVKHCADVNSPGKNGHTPIRNILEKENFHEERKKALVKCIFEHAKYVDIDDEKGTVRAALIELSPELELADGESKRQDEEFDFVQCLQDGNEPELWKHCSDDKDDFYQNFDLCVAVRNGLVYSVERLLRSPDNEVSDSSLYGIFAAAFDHHFNSNSEKCLEMILSHRNVDVNVKCGSYTPLLCSLDFRLSNVTAKLLRQGVYFAVDDKSQEITLSSIKLQLLQKHFDSCITTDRPFLNEENLLLTFVYKNLLPMHRKNTPEDDKIKFCEMRAVEHISEMDALRPLLKHPLVESFVELKWNRFAPIFYANFIVYFLFATLNIFQIFFFFLKDVESTVSTVLIRMLMTFLILMIVREAAQLLSSPLVYLSRLQNYVECALIGFVGFILFGNCPLDWRGTVAAIAILLITYELSVLLGSLPIRFFAMHFVMLETVATNFFKSLLFYSIIIVAFALTFTSLFHKFPSDGIEQKVPSVSSNETDDDSEKEYNNFQNVGLSLLKSMVMFNGELDTSSIPLADNPFSYVIFVVFVLLVTTALGNLLSGLAVSDINEIRSQAELIYLSRRCEVLAEYERIFMSRRSSLYRFPKLERFLRSKIWLFPDYRMEYNITFKPNSKDSKSEIDEDIINEAMKKVNGDGTEGDETETLKNEISKIADSNDLSNETIRSMQWEIKVMGKRIKNSNFAMQHELGMLKKQYSAIADSNDSMVKMLKSMEKMLEKR